MRNLAITGPTSGIGEETVKKLITQFDQIFLLARDQTKVNDLIGSFPLKDQKKLILEQKA